jgi:3-oxoacyl-[acyl-carrier-protein] synthase II
MRTVAVTGIGVVSALGHGIDHFWQELVAGRSGITRIERLGACGAAVGSLEGVAFARSAASRRIDRASLLALGACRLALADAEATPLAGGARTGLSLGSAFGNVSETTVFLDRLIQRGAGNPLVFPNLVMNASLSYASIELGITGPTAMLSEQEASGEAAIAHGAQLIADGTVDLCLAGAVDELDAVVCEVLGDAQALSAGMPRPFDPAADGSAPGEGAAVLVLEAASHARARGARVHAHIVPHPGFAVPAPLHAWAEDAAPLGERLAPVMHDADVVFAAASGRPALDALEAAALARALAGRPTPVTAVRGAVGDFGAAGALAVAAAARALATATIPPTLGLVPPARAGLDVVVETARRTPLRVAVVNGLARGGACRPVRLEAAA